MDIIDHTSIIVKIAAIILHGMAAIRDIEIEDILPELLHSVIMINMKNTGDILGKLRPRIPPFSS